MTDSERFMPKLSEYRKNPVQFVRQVIGADPTDQQAKLLKALAEPGAHVTVRSGHGTGKSTVLSWAVLWFVLLHPHSKAPCTAPTSHQLKDVLWAEAAKWRDRMHPYFKDQLVVTADRISAAGAEKSQFAVARTARRDNPDALQGFHADHLMFVIDEASGVDEKVFEVAEGALSTPTARVVMTGNPTRTTGYFHRSHHKDRALWNCLRFSCTDSPLVGRAYEENMALKYGKTSDIYRIRVLGDFPRASASQLISVDSVDEARKREIDREAWSFAPIYLGVDVARFGDDKSAIIKRQGLKASILGTWRGLDTMDLAAKVAELETEHRADAVFIDAGGVGAGVVDRLRHLGRNPVEVNFGGRADRDETYLNKRAEMWARMRDWLKSGGSLPGDKGALRDTAEELAQDIIGPHYSFDDRSRLALERKAEMKKRGLASPDLGDALALTFAHNIPKRTDRGGYETRRAVTDYDVFQQEDTDYEWLHRA